LGIGDWAQSPIPNPQSPIPNPHWQKENYILIIFYKLKNNLIIILKCDIVFNKFIKK